VIVDDDLEEQVRQVFGKVVSHLALYARSTTMTPADGWYQELLGGTLGNERPLTLINHPFVCQRGAVRADVAPGLDLATLRRDVTVCPAHTYARGEPGGCAMHPVVAAGDLAAWALGGPDAVVRRKGSGWSSQVFDAWRHTLVNFSNAITLFDKQQATYPQRREIGMYLPPLDPTDPRAVHTSMALLVRPKRQRRRP
jgi:hypothetical protein